MTTFETDQDDLYGTDWRAMIDRLMLNAGEDAALDADLALAIDCDRVITEEAEAEMAAENAAVVWAETRGQGGYDFEPDWAS